MDEFYQNLSRLLENVFPTKVVVATNDSNAYCGGERQTGGRFAVPINLPTCKVLRVNSEFLYMSALGTLGVSFPLHSFGLELTTLPYFISER